MTSNRPVVIASHMYWPRATAVLLTVGLLATVQLKMQPAGLLLERLLPGGGWIEIAVLALYAGWLAGRLQRPKTMRFWRPRLWLLFSVVFFLQLAIGLAGIESLLMTGKLHVPVPAVIAAGPLFRGGGFFMLILFGASLLLVGPAWCSWLCYIGAWDNLAAQVRRLPQPLPRWRRSLRLVLLIVVVATAYLMGRAGLPGSYAAVIAVAFGLAGIALMATWSRRTGSMTHCTAYCPIGWLATRCGWLSPWRIRIDTDCTDCMACGKVCRFDALHDDDIKLRKVGESCTLCGDCIVTCAGRSIRYGFLGYDSDRVRLAFLALICSLHAAFLGVARI